MTIDNFNNSYLRVKSNLLSEVIADPEDFQYIRVTGNINCCVDNNDEEVIKTEDISATESIWNIDLNNAVGFESSTNNIVLVNTQTGLQYKIPLSVDLSYVVNNCTGENCTLETFASYFDPLFKDVLDDWFASHSIASAVSIDFVGNVVEISTLPEDFIVESIDFGETPTIVYATYNGDKHLFVDSQGLLITPSFFGLTKLMDGVYKLTVRIVKNDLSYTEEINCSFVDISIKCKVASTLNILLEEQRTVGSEKCSTMIHMLHYALVNGSNCGCNCGEMCEVYTELYNLLDQSNTTNNECGC